MNWDEIHASKEGPKYPDIDLVRFMAANYYKAPDRANTKILEIGSGTGTNIEYLYKEGFMGYGVDGSQVATDQARKKLPNVIGLPLVCKSIMGFLVNVEFDVFDAIIDIESVYCNDLEASKKIYSECHRILKPGGKLFVKTFADGTSPAMLDKTYFRLTEREDIPALLADFKIESIDLVTRTQRQHSVREWIIVASK